jgi:hypothetical protein
VRHITGFILALAMSAALFFGGGWGIARIIVAHGGSEELGSGHALMNTHGLLAVAAVFGTGLLLGILLAIRGISPIGTGLPGLVLLGWSTLVIIGSRYAFKLVPLHGSSYAAGFTTMLLHGVLLLIGAAMVVPLLVPSRWRRADTNGDVDYDDIDVPAELGLVP